MHTRLPTNLEVKTVQAWMQEKHNIPSRKGSGLQLKEQLWFFSACVPHSTLRTHVENFVTASAAYSGIPNLRTIQVFYFSFPKLSYIQ